MTKLQSEAAVTIEIYEQPHPRASLFCKYSVCVTCEYRGYHCCAWESDDDKQTAKDNAIAELKEKMLAVDRGFETQKMILNNL